MSDNIAIPQKIGLSDSQFDDFLTKQKAFLDTLSPEQRAMFLKTQPTSNDAAGALDIGVTGADLETFIKSRAGAAASVFGMMTCDNC
jgi:hypothetical protein